jgi:hypothetical protein
MCRLSRSRRVRRAAARRVGEAVLVVGNQLLALGVRAWRRGDGADAEDARRGRVDRLLHPAHMIVTHGMESYRLAQATAGKRVAPLG